VSPWRGSALEEGEHSKDNKMINIFYHAASRGRKAKGGFFYLQVKLISTDVRSQNGCLRWLPS
jgi:hypothetical protein